MFSNKKQAILTQILHFLDIHTFSQVPHSSFSFYSSKYVFGFWCLSLMVSKTEVRLWNLILPQGVPLTKRRTQLFKESLKCDLNLAEMRRRSIWRLARLFYSTLLSSSDKKPSLKFPSRRSLSHKFPGFFISRGNGDKE